MRECSGGCMAGVCDRCVGSMERVFHGRFDTEGDVRLLNGDL